MPWSRRTNLAWALLISVALHGGVFFYPYFNLTQDDTADHNDVLSHHAGGKVPKVHVNLDNTDALAGGRVLHIHWIISQVSHPAVATLVPHAALHHASTQHRKHHLSRKTIKAKNLTTHPESPAVASTQQAPSDTPKNPLPAQPTAAITVPPATPEPATPEPATPEPATPAPPPTVDNTNKTSEDTHEPVNHHAIEVPTNLDLNGFPHDIRALYHIRVGLAIPVGLDAMEHWQIEGHQYHLQLDAHKFGYHARIISQGLISEHGLAPAHFELSLNGKVKNVANFSYTDHLLQQGHPDNLKTAPFDEGAQDMFSFAYHLAISFSGHDQLNLTVTNGNNLYNLMFTVVGEETLQLPAGTLRTLHLQGSRQAVGSTQVQSGFDAWLAPDFSNFPVKMSGPDSSGHIFVMAIKALEFEGRPLFGQDLPAENPQDATPPPADIQNIPDLQSASSSQKN
ncbi:MAG: DUF3108 domain-containing protein [Pseudomonadales bacterium]|nr:DUF3108 domain-containing protein [Pseudomonadales bacterium]